MDRAVNSCFLSSEIADNCRKSPFVLRSGDCPGGQRGDVSGYYSLHERNVPSVTRTNEAEIKSWNVCKGFGGQDFTG